MAYPVLMPKPGQMTEECKVVAWHKQVGDLVHKGDALFEIETDKSNMDVEAFDEGVLLRIVADIGDTVPVNTVCGWVGRAGEAIPDTNPASPTGQLLVGVESAISEATRPAGPVAAQRQSGSPISPRAARLAITHSIDPRTIVGTGPRGRIVERDVQAVIALRSADPAVPSARGPILASTAPVSAARGTSEPVAIDPEAVEAAAQAFVISSGIRGTGPSGRVTRADVESTLRGRPQPLSRMRQIIAQRLTESYTTTPHFSVTVAVDMTALLRLREQRPATVPAYSVTDFIVAAVVPSLVEFPVVNGRTDGKSIWLREHVDLGLAVALDTGLVVPVIREAERMELSELHDRAGALVAAARAGRLAPEDLSGSSFTISNMGMFGVENFTAIINPGEAAILAVSSTVATPVVVDGGVGVGQVMRMALSADHRLVDGVLAARFLDAVRQRLEHPAGPELMEQARPQGVGETS